MIDQVNLVGLSEAADAQVAANERMSRLHPENSEKKTKIIECWLTEQWSSPGRGEVGRFDQVHCEPLLHSSAPREAETAGEDPGVELKISSDDPEPGLVRPGQLRLPQRVRDVHHVVVLQPEGCPGICGLTTHPGG